GGSNQIFLQWVFANAIYEKDFISFEQLYNITLNQFGEEILESVLNGAFAGIKCAANSKTLTPLLVTMCHKYASGFMVIWNAIDDKEKSKFLQESFKKVKITREERKLTGALSNILL
ncbi:MAG: hypothetical protein J6S61_00195, partial [Elusimicrobiaceae bacterium]|nr:hypothetical protein [Elusimicrobiaceae bacterium]